MSGQLRLNALFTDHMVLQREKNVPFWGTGAEGATVTVRCGDASAKAVVAGGEWKAELPPLAVGGPYEVVVEAGDERLALADVLVGDVWLAGGQSNMEWRLNDTNGGKEEAANASLPRLRYYEVPRVAYDDGRAHAGAWQVCSPETAGGFTAVGYYFAKALQPEIGVPVGIVGCNWGGTSASCWVPREKLANDEGLRVYLDEYEAAVAGLDDAAFRKLEADYQAEIDACAARQAAGEADVMFPWPPPTTDRCWLRPNALYDTMLKPTAPFAVKGFLYYQGESDAGKAELYDRLMGVMIEQWRDDWGDAGLPFLFVQLPAFGDGTDREHDTYNWPKLREAQLKVTEQVPHTAMAVILDCGDELDIHPRNKKPVGDRLAAIALREVYGRDVACYGPTFRELTVAGDVATVRFDHAEQGLAAASGELPGFQIAEADGVYRTASAKIVGDAVEVRGEGVREPVAVRYAWASWPSVSLFGAGGLPAAPFRTDRASR